MKKLFIIFALLFACSSYGQTIINSKTVLKQTTCIDGITYFVASTFQGSIGYVHTYVSSVKIDSKTMQPQKCD